MQSKEPSPRPPIRLAFGPCINTSKVVFGNITNKHIGYHARLLEAIEA